MEWIKIDMNDETTYPEYDEMVLIPGNKDHPVYVARTYKDEEFHFLDEWGNLCNPKMEKDVDHWMPLPEPPQD